MNQVSLDTATMLAELAADEFDGVFDVYHELNGVAYRRVMTKNNHGKDVVFVEVCGVSGLAFMAEGCEIMRSSVGMIAPEMLKRYGYRADAEILVDCKELAHA